MRRSDLEVAVVRRPRVHAVVEEVERVRLVANWHVGVKIKTKKGIRVSVLFPDTHYDWVCGVGAVPSRIRAARR